MAITVDDTPNAMTVKGQKLIYVCSSDNTTETGFKYIVVVKDSGATQIAKFYIPANPAGSLIFDLRQVVYGLVNVDTVDSQQSDGIIHNLPHASDQQVTIAPQGSKKFTVEFGEYYDSTEDLALETETIYITDGSLNPADGYQNTMPEFDSALTTDRGFLLNREEEYFPLGDVTGVIIETNESEWGVVAFKYDSTGLFSSTADAIQYGIYDSGGTLVGVKTTQSLGASYGGASTGSTDGEDKLLYFGAYPSNINSANSPIIINFQPQSVANWSYYTMRLWDSGLGAAASRYLIFVNTCPPQKHQQAQLAWTNTVGGWEYLSFNGRTNHTVKSKSKEYTKTLASYAGTTFGYDTFDRQTTPFHIDTELMYTLTKANSSDVDTRLMESLAKSKNVMVSLTPSEWLPVTVEGANFEMQPNVISKQTVITVKIKLAQVQE